MNQKGPGEFFGKTDYYISWSFRWDGKPGNCRITSAIVDTEIKTFMPVWQDQASASPGLQAKWQQFYDVLMEHEQGHASLAKTGAADVRQAINALPGKPSCDQLEREANNVGNRILDRVRQQNVRYDAQTDHGRNDGAIW